MQRQTATLNKEAKKLCDVEKKNTKVIVKVSKGGSNSLSQEITNAMDIMNIDEEKKMEVDYEEDFPCEPSDKNFYLKRENQVLIQNYGPDLYEYSRELECEEIPAGFIGRHKFEASVRTKMVDWMIEVLYAYNSDTPTLFLAVDIMDCFIAKSKAPIHNQDIHLTGICSMYIASKMEDIIPLRMSHVKSKIGHNKFSEREIKAREKLILDTLNFNIIKTSTYDFIKTFIFDFCHNNRDFIKNLNMSHHIDIFDNICVFLSKMMCHNEDFAPFNYSLKAISCIVAAFDILRSNSTKLSKDAEHFMRQWVSI